MSFKNWSWWNKLITILGGLAAIAVLIDSLNDNIDIFIPVFQWVIKMLFYPVAFFWIPASIIVFFFLLWLLSKLNAQEDDILKTDVLKLNDDCEARYSYFLSKDGVTLNTISNNEGYTLYCSTHDLRLSRFHLGNEWLCPDPNCNHQKRVGNYDFIISLIERQIRQTNT